MTVIQSVFQGGTIIVSGSNMFQKGIVVGEFSDEGDPFTLNPRKIRDGAMTLQTTAVYWTTAELIRMTVRVVANTPVDTSLRQFFESNAAQSFGSGSKDVVTMTISYPNGSKTTFSNGSCDSYSPAMGAAQSGRLTQSEYSFMFAKVTNEGA